MHFDPRKVSETRVYEYLGVEVIPQICSQETAGSYFDPVNGYPE
jgi:hypothetical protein